jgi:hypothetical protein
MMHYIGWHSLFCNLEVMSSNPDPDTSYADSDVSWLSSVIPTKCKNNTPEKTKTISFHITESISKQRDCNVRRDTDFKLA